MKNDLISRQAAIDDMKNMYQAAEKWGQEADDDVIKARAESCMASLVEMKLRIEKLPSVQPKPLTDEEQRIFLRAMEREEKVCKHVDNVYNNSYEDSLVRTCHEITRKVKGALWTTT